MKSLRSALPALLLGALLPLCASAQTNPPPNNPAQKSEARWEQAETRESQDMLNRLRVLEQRISEGSGPQQKIDQLELKNAMAQLEVIMPSRPWRLNVTYPGGPLTKFLALIDRPGVATIEIISAGTPKDLDVELPAFSLKNADPETIFGVLQNFLEPRGYLLNPAGRLDKSDSVVAVLHSRLEGHDATPGSQSELESLQLTDYLFENQTVDTIVDAIRMAWTLDPQRDAAALKIQFHPPTKMLLVSGPVPAAALAQKVVAGLRKKPAPR